MLHKIATTVLVMLLAAATVSGQIATPAPSPAAMFKQTVGLTEVTVEYSRPAVRERTIFGDLVPYGELWRTGANRATKITFSDDVTIEGEALSAGSYAILTTPGENSWGVHFHAYEGGNWGSYREKEAAVTATVTPVTIPGIKVENFFITVADLKSDGGTLEFVWDQLLVPVKIGVHTDKTVMANIENVLAGPSAGDYFAAGTYLHESGKDLNKALTYVQKATNVDNPRFWQVRREALILADLGRKAEAIAAAKKSLELATTAGNSDYVRLNEKSLKEWSM